MCGPVVSNTNTNGVMKNGQSNGNSSVTSQKKPSPTSSLRRMTPLILKGYLFNTICYFAFRHVLLPASLVPDPQYCPEDEPQCDRRDLFAFQIVSFFNLSALGLLGFYSFFISKRAISSLPATPQGRYLGHHVLDSNNKGLSDADYINAVIVIFQGWDFIASIPFEEHCTTIMMTHHTLAFICGFFCLWYEVNPFYAVYFGGVSEFSSIFLCTSQLFQYYPPSNFAEASSSLSSALHAFEAFSQAMFVLTFFAFRIIGWAKYSHMLLLDGIYVLKHGLLKRYAPSSTWFLWYLLSMSVLLGALQVYWLKGIADKIAEISNQ